MNNVYQYMELLGEEGSKPLAGPPRPKNRLEIEQYRLVQERLRHGAYGHEQGERHGHVAASINRVRVVIGSLLISAGERIGQESMHRERTQEADTYDNVRHA